MSRWQLKVSTGGSKDYALFLVLKHSRPKSVDERWNVFMPPESAKRLLCFQETRRCPSHDAGGSSTIQSGSPVMGRIVNCGFDDVACQVGEIQRELAASRCSRYAWRVRVLATAIICGGLFMIAQ